MTKAVRLVLSLCALTALVAVGVGCGGVPGNAVATVDGTDDQQGRVQPLDDHRRQVERPGQRRGAGLYRTSRKCVAAEAQVASEAQPRASRTRPTTSSRRSASRSTTQLRDQVLQLLISFQWIQGEAKEQGIKVTDAEVKKSFDEQKKQSFPKDADYQKFLKDIRPDGGRHPPARQARPAVEQDPRQDHQGQGQGLRRPDQRLLQQEQGPLRAAREARPARRPDQGPRPRPTKAKAALENGESWKTVAKKYSIDDTSKAAGRQAPRAGQGHAREGARRRRLRAPRRASSSARSRPSSATTSSTVDKITRPRSRRSREAKETIKQTLQSQNQQKALDTFVKDFTKRWKEQDGVLRGLQDQDCKRPEGHADPDSGDGARPAQPTATPQN